MMPTSTFTACVFAHHPKKPGVPNCPLTRTHPHRARYIPTEPSTSPRLPTLPNPRHLHPVPSGMHSQSSVESPKPSTSSASVGSLILSERIASLQLPQGFPLEQGNMSLFPFFLSRALSLLLLQTSDYGLQVIPWKFCPRFMISLCNTTPALSQCPGPLVI